MKETADEARRRRPHRRAGAGRAGGSGARCPGPRGATSGGTRRWRDSPPSTRPSATDPEDPYMIIYTSGTTGKPKGAVHVHCGFPIKAAAGHGPLLRRPGTGDTLFWFTDIGWMMGPWAIVGTLILGAPWSCTTARPTTPAPDRLWAMVERHGVTVLGLSPTVIRALMRHGDEVGSRPRPHQPARAGLAPASRGTPSRGGGTSSRSAAAAARSSTTPAARRSPGGILGCNVDPAPEAVQLHRAGARDGRGGAGRERQPVRGEVGELVIRKPWAGMTRGFWSDRDRYLETYWSRWPGVWVHGDWAIVDEEGFWYILGRSDDTIKVAGKRLGPGRGRVRGGGAPGGVGGGRHRRARRAEGRGAGLLRRPAARATSRATTLRAEIKETRRAAAWARRSSRRRCGSSATCRRPGTPRSCDALSGLPTWARRRWGMSPPWRTRRRWRK